MNIFILNSGRCGSTTFIRACEHISNYTAGHESNISQVGEARLDYPDQHIEADNRLSWLLGRLDGKYADRAFYVHLHRDREKVARSFAKRMEFGIMKAYREGILLGGQKQQDAYSVAMDYLDTVEENIRLFLRDKHNKMDFKLENANKDFPVFWERIGAEGDLQSALLEWTVRHNASETS